MDIVATQKYVRTSPKKLRLVADAVRRVNPKVALDVLPQMGLRAGEPMAKVIKTALANARQAGVSEEGLIFKEIQISQGPTLKRGQPVSKGSWHPIKKRMSHIRVVLTTNSKPETLKSKETQKVEITKSGKEKKSKS